jgi:hypothetical protein
LNIREKVELFTEEDLKKESFDLFNFNQCEFMLGQWVDCLDTVDQWLEAQVISLPNTNNPNKVLIHYNGWGNRWDEWIQMTSERLRPFRFNTRQKKNNFYTSACPNKKIDTEIDFLSLNQTRNIDIKAIQSKIELIGNKIIKEKESFIEKKGTLIKFNKKNLVQKIDSLFNLQMNCIEDKYNRLKLGNINK